MTRQRLLALVACASCVLVALAPACAVMALLEMRNPSPLASVHLTPAVDEAQVNGPRVIDWP